MRRVSHHIGMPISIDIPLCNDTKVFNECWILCNQIDEQFSPYKKDSEVSKVADGRLKIEQASNVLKDIVDLCSVYEKETQGWFSIYFNNKFNPTGIVKAWAIDSLQQKLLSAGYKEYLINAGGDIACSANTKKWQIGISSPYDPNISIGTINADTTSVATSGSYQKGAHIFNPKTGLATTELNSVTVIGPDIIRADVYATALYAMGYKAMSFANNLKPGYKALILDKNNYVYSI